MFMEGFINSKMELKMGRKILKIFLIALLCITLVIWIMIFASSHNIPTETHLCFFVVLFFLVFLLVIIRISKS